MVLLWVCFLFTSILALAPNAAAETEADAIPEALVTFPVEDIRFLDAEQCDAIQALISNYDWNIAGVKNLFSDEDFENIHQDPAVFAVAYADGERFLEKFAAAGGIPAGYTAAYPAVYIPVFGSVEGAERIIGHSVLFYDWMAKAYELDSVGYSKRSVLEPSISAGRFLTQLGVLDDFRPAAQAIGKEISKGILLQIGYKPGTAYVNTCILLAQADGKWYIYDPENTAYLPEGEERPVLSPEEYLQLRQEGKLRNQSPGVKIINLFISNMKLLVLVVIGVLAIAGAVFLAYWIIKLVKWARLKKHLCVFLVFGLGATMLCGCGNSEWVDREMSMFIKTIDRPDSGVGEVILGTLRISGRWSADDTGAKFSGSLGTAGLEDYGVPYHDPSQEVEITFTWESGHWVGSIPYTANNGKSKILTVYTDKEHSIWLFESEGRVTIAPAEHIKDVLAICAKLGIELK